MIGILSECVRLKSSLKNDIICQLNKGPQTIFNTVIT